MLKNDQAANTAASTIGLCLVAVGILWGSLASPLIPSLPVIALGLLLILSQNRPLSTPLRWAILILLVMGIVSFFATADRDTTVWYVSQLFLGIAGFYALVNWARQPRQLELTSLAILLGGALIAIAAPVIVQWDSLSGVPIPSIIYQPFPLLLSDPVHPNIMASLMILVLPLSISYLLLKREERPWPLASIWGRVFLAAAFIAMATVFVLTKSRGGYVAGVLGILIVLWLSRRRILATVIAVIALALAIWLITNIEQPGAAVVSGFVDTDTLAFRQQVWQVATWMIKDFAYTGVGMGTFNDVAMRLYPFPEVMNPGAHNLFLQVALDLGILGLIAYLSILLLTIFMAYTSIKRFNEQEIASLRAISIGLLAGFIALILHGFVDIGVWGTRIAFLPWLTIGLITAIHLHTHQKP